MADERSVQTTTEPGRDVAGGDSGVAAALDLAASVAEWRGGSRRARLWRRRPGGLLSGVAATLVIAFAAVGIFVLGMVAHARVNGGNGASSAQVVVANGSAGAGNASLYDKEDPSRGPANARVTIVEYADFQCPYCGQFHARTLPLILQQYGDRVRFVYRDFPLTQIHPFAEKAAEAAECANQQGKFWSYHDLLFNNQSALDRASLGKYATEVGLKMDSFNSCLDSGKAAPEVADDEQAGVAAGVTGTPSFFINGHPIVGSQPFAAFQSAIDQALASTN